ncbi:MAG: hypothetical protein WA198_08825 [Candidatus Sulfotelmatobacter sp.]
MPKRYQRKTSQVAQQRLYAINQRDPHWHLGKAARCSQAAEPGTDNDQPRTAMCVVRRNISSSTIRTGGTP